MAAGNGFSTKPPSQGIDLMIRLNRLQGLGSSPAASRSTASHIVTDHVDAGFVVFGMHYRAPENLSERLAVLSLPG